MLGNKERKLKVLTVVLFAFLLSPMFAQNKKIIFDFNSGYCGEKDKSTSDFEVGKEDSSPEVSENEGMAQEGQSFVVSKENAATFNVTESVKSVAPYNNTAQKSLLEIEKANSTLEVPEGWEFNKQTTNISGLYKDWETVQDGNVTITEEQGAGAS